MYHVVTFPPLKHYHKAQHYIQKSVGDFNPQLTALINEYHKMIEQALKSKDSSPSEISRALISFFAQEFPLGGTASEHRFVQQIFPMLIQRLFGPSSVQSCLIFRSGEIGQEEIDLMESAWFMQSRQWRTAVNSVGSNKSYSTYVHAGPPKLDSDPVVQLLSPPSNLIHTPSNTPAPSSLDDASRPLSFFQVITEDSTELPLDIVKSAQYPVKFSDLSFHFQQALLLSVLKESNLGNEIICSGKVTSSGSNAMNLVELLSVPFSTQKDLVSNLKLMLQQIYSSHQHYYSGVTVSSLSSPSRNVPMFDSMLSPRKGSGVVTNINSLEDHSQIQLNLLEYYAFMLVRCPFVMGEITNIGKLASAGAKSTTSTGTYGYRPSYKAASYGEKVYLHLLKDYIQFFFPHVFEETRTPESFDRKKSEMILRIMIEFWLERHKYASTKDALENTSSEYSKSGDPGKFSLGDSFDLAELLPVGQNWNMNTTILTRQPYVASCRQVYKSIRTLVDNLVCDPDISKNCQRKNAGVKYQQGQILEDSNEPGWPIPLFQTIIQPSLYNYIRTGLRYGPVHVTNSSFYQAMDLWLLWIEPWNVTRRKKSYGALQAKELLQNVAAGVTHTNPPKHQNLYYAVNNTPKPNQISKYDSSWKSYVAANLHFYLVPLAIFLRRARELDFSKLDFNKSIIQIQRVMRVYSSSLVETIDSILSDTGCSDLTSIVEHHEHILADFCPPRNSGEKNWSLEMLQSDMQNLLEEIVLSHRKTISEQDSLERLSAFIEGLFGEGSKAEDKAIHHVISLAKHLVKFPIDHVIVPEVGRDRFFGRRNNVSPTSASNSVTNVHAPEREKNGLISEKGRSQLVHGIRICTAMDVNFLGDPMYARPKSHEIKVLVKLALYASNYLNVRFGLDAPRQVKLYGDEGSWSTEQLVQDGARIANKGGFRFNLRFLADTRNWIVIAITLSILRRKLFG
jgi:hypothetical protein